MSKFDAEACERCERIDDEATAIVGVVIAFPGIRSYLEHTVDTDRVGDPALENR